MIKSTSFYDEQAVNDERIRKWRIDIQTIPSENGIREKWLYRGVLHCPIDPAVIYMDGIKEWRRNGNLYRDNDLPAIVRGNGDKEWWISKWVRDGERQGYVEYSHRDYGLPAIECANGDKLWWEDGVYQKAERKNPVQKVQPNDPIVLHQFTLEKLNYEEVDECSICMGPMTTDNQRH